MRLIWAVVLDRVIEIIMSAIILSCSLGVVVACVQCLRALVRLLDILRSCSRRLSGLTVKSSSSVNTVVCVPSAIDFCRIIDRIVQVYGRCCRLRC